jgi:prepilin-type N-terminal cleavage/methylation domain-containing protein
VVLVKEVIRPGMLFPNFGFRIVKVMEEQMEKPGKTQSGFTLLETVAAVALAGLMIGILGQVLLQCTYTQKQLAGRVTAAVLGAGKLAELARQADSGNIGEFPEPYRQYRWSCRTDTLGNGLEKLELTVEWSGQNGVSQKRTWQRYRPAE